MFVPYARAYQFFLRIAARAMPWRTPMVLEGPDSSLRIPGLLKSLGLSDILVVTGRHILGSGLIKPLLDALAGEGIRAHVYGETVPNPTVDNIEAALALYRAKGCSAILAVGGGSPMDCAKIVGARVARPKKPVSAMKGLLKVNKRLPPIIAVPTTAGTGSETTIAAVISDPSTHRKYAISDFCLMPRWAVLDPRLSLGLPAAITATTGMDALTHAVEAYIGRGNTRSTEADAIGATRLIMANLEAVYARPDDLQGRQAMLKAAFLAGRAFTRAYVGYVHAMAHAVGGLYGIAHGLANAVIMPHVLDHYGTKARKRLAALARASGACPETADDLSAAKEFIRRIESMNMAMGIGVLIEEIREADVSLLASQALSEANPLYPVPMILSRGDMEALFRRVGGLGETGETSR